MNRLRPDNLFHVLTTPGATMSHEEALRVLNEEEWCIRIDCFQYCKVLLEEARNRTEAHAWLLSEIYDLENKPYKKRRATSERTSALARRL